ncbi:MAG: hypothetical protein ACK6BG_00800 [Cyanobacteriota bacterium]
MANLATITFTKRNDSAISPVVDLLYEGWTLDEEQAINALSGNDVISGGLSNSSTLLTDDGNDVISAPIYRGISNSESGTINTGNGRDTITITSDGAMTGDTESITSLTNAGMIDLGEGHDSIVISFESDSANEEGIIPWLQYLLNSDTGKLLTGNGDDLISVTGTITFESQRQEQLGIWNGGLLDTGEGNDTISSNGMLGNFNDASVLTGSGNDIISCSFVGNLGSMDTGSGHDTINGINDKGYFSKSLFDSSLTWYGVVNTGALSLGNGNDLISGQGPRFGIGNVRDDGPVRAATAAGIIDTGSGNDTINGIGEDTLLPTAEANVQEGGAGINNEGTILLGNGDDLIYGKSGGSGISNTGTIDTGSGRDVITGVGSETGIANGGTILTGRGKDTVDALEGGFSGEGTLNLGDGNDILMGFGGGNFLGGDGIDTLIFKPGTYIIRPAMEVRSGVEGAVSVAETYLISNADQQMIVSQFERFGKGADYTIFSDAVQAGQVTFI